MATELSATDRSELGELAKKIADAHAEVETFGRRTVERAAAVGEMLKQAKSQVPHGQWETWILAQFPFSLRTARNYMQAHDSAVAGELLPGATLRSLIAPEPPKKQVAQNTKSATVADLGQWASSDEDDEPAEPVPHQEHKPADPHGLRHTADEFDESDQPLDVDERGEPIWDEGIAAIFADATALTHTVSAINKAKKLARAAKQSAAGPLFQLQNVEAHLDAARNECTTALPYCQIPEGVEVKREVRAAGYMRKADYKQLPK